MALKDILAAVSPAKPADAKAKMKYVRFTQEEWSKMESSAGETLETNSVKALVEAIFSGAVTLGVAKK